MVISFFCQELYLSRRKHKISLCPEPAAGFVFSVTDKCIRLLHLRTRYAFYILYRQLKTLHLFYLFSAYQMYALSFKLGNRSALQFIRLFFLFLAVLTIGLIGIHVAGLFNSNL